MTGRLGLMDFFEKKSNILIALALSVIVLLGLEFLIFIALASYAGEQSRIEVKDRDGRIVYQTAGNKLDHLDRWYFERQYGNLDNYGVEVKTITKPFPVRAWVSASVGVPVVLILLISYLVKVYLNLLHDEKKETGQEYPVLYGRGYRLMSWANFLNSHSIFYLGVFIGFGALTFWMVPNFLADVVKFSINITRDNKWFILTPLVLLAAFAGWTVYLRYKLSKRMMDHQFSLEKYRLDRELLLREQLASDVLEPVNKSLDMP